MSLLYSIIQVERCGMGEQYTCQRQNIKVPYLDQNPRNKKNPILVHSSSNYLLKSLLCFTITLFTPKEDTTVQYK